MVSATEPVSGVSGFMPHGMCYLWQKDVLYLHVISDSLIVLAYYSIPLALVYFVTRRRDVSYNWMFIMFALFIVACGTTHLMSIWTIWNPDYREEGIIKALTAAVSMATAIALWYIMPKALLLPSPNELVVVNDRLETELSERKRYQQKLKKAHSRLKQQFRVSLVSQMNSRLQTCKVVDEVEPIIEHYFPRLFPDSSGGVYIHNNSTSMNELVAGWGDNPPIRPAFKNQQCHALRQGSMHVARYPGIDTDLPCEHYEDEAARNCICIPLIADASVIGLLYIRLPDPDSRDEDLDDSQQELTLTSTAEHLGLILANLRMREELEMRSVRDPLTNLYNRRYMEESFEREVARSQRSGDKLAVLLLDIDHFKEVNDNHGHEMGDTALKEIARFMELNVRAEDIVSRYGGEEFVIIMPGIRMKNARERADLLREGIRSLSIINKGQHLAELTVSIGVALYPSDSEDTDSLLGLADKALYEAKNAGRNRVVFAGDMGESDNE